MDTIAALNFKLVITTTLRSFDLKEKNDLMKHRILAGIFAGSILALIYLMLSYMGMWSSGVYSIQENGVWTLRCIVLQLFWPFGAYLLTAISTLVCLTTSVGLINSISQYFSTLFKKRYRTWVCLIIGFSFLVCSLELTTILSILIPVLNVIYPVAIVLIILGMIKNKPFVYPIVISETAVMSIINALDLTGIPIPWMTLLYQQLPFYQMGFG